MNADDISTQLMYTTAPIYAQLPDNRISTGTGFIFSAQVDEKISIPLFLTNYHVIANASYGYLELHSSENGKPTNKMVAIQFDNNILQEGKLGDIDLVALPLAGAFNDVQSKGATVFYKSISAELFPKESVIENLSAIENVTFIGYPNSIYDSVNKIPVIRQGISATPIWNDFEGKEEFLIDAGAFPGSSGSPVFIYNQGAYPSNNDIIIGSRLLFVGILSGTLMRKENIGNTYLDLGVVINSKAVFRELNKYISDKTGHPISTES